MHFILFFLAFFWFDNTSNFLKIVPKILIQRHRPETNFADTEVAELIAMLRETEQLEEQGDILQYLVDTQGLDFNTGEFLFHFVNNWYAQFLHTQKH